MLLQFRILLHFVLRLHSHPAHWLVLFLVGSHFLKTCTRYQAMGLLTYACKQTPQILLHSAHQCPSTTQTPPQRCRLASSNNPLLQHSPTPPQEAMVAGLRNPPLINRLTSAHSNFILTHKAAACPPSPFTRSDHSTAIAAVATSSARRIKRRVSAPFQTAVAHSRT